jgi:hypothetical protein
MEKTAKYLLITMLAILILFAISVAICAFIDFFNIDSIQIINNERFDDSRYLSEISGFIGKNGFRIIVGDIDSLKSFFMAFALRNTKAEQNYISNDPYVAGAKVSFLPPDKIVVDIIERKESFRITFLDKIVYLSKDLVVLGGEADCDVPEITGVDVISCEEGETVSLGSDAENALDGIYENSVYQGKDILDKISRIDFSSGLTLLMSNNVCVVFGDASDMEYKMKCLNEIYYEYLHEYSDGILDLSDKSRKVYSPG